MTQFSTQVKEVTASPTESHSAIRHNTDPVSAHAQNRPPPLAFSSSEPVVSWSRGLRYKLSRVALGTRMVPGFLRENLGKEVASVWPKKSERVTFIFRRLRNHNRELKQCNYDDSENVAKKLNLRPFKIYRLYFYPRNMSYVGDFSWK